MSKVTELLPHRPPFLFVDRVVSINDKEIMTEKYFQEDCEFYQGHYPGNPITPGVILCEAIFQSGAILLGQIPQKNNVKDMEQLPVLTRIQNAKFKRSVFPGDTVQIRVSKKETMAGVAFLKGVLKVAGKTAVLAEFSCTMTSVPD